MDVAAEYTAFVTNLPNGAEANIHKYRRHYFCCSAPKIARLELIDASAVKGVRSLSG